MNKEIVARMVRARGCKGSLRQEQRMSDLTRRQFNSGLVAGLGLAALPWRALAHAGDWSDAARLPIRVQEIYPALVHGRIYVMGGLSPDVEGRIIGISDRVFSWRPGEDTWREHPALPVPTHHGNCVEYDGRLFCIGGFNRGERDIWRNSAAVHAFDTQTEIWSEGPALPAPPQAETVLGAIDGKLHLVGGRRTRDQQADRYEDQYDVAEHLVFDGARWEAAAPLPTARNSAAGAVIDGRLHVVGGRTMAGGNLDVHEAYDPATDSWTTLAPLPRPERGPKGSGGLAAAAIGDALYAFGGEWLSEGGGVYAQVWRWSASSDTWQQATIMPMPRHGLGAVELDDTIYTIGGATGPGVDGTSDAVAAYRPPT
jgi:N-acetylneuraminic acid mutarotase